jgi:hypothetical protein
MKTTIQVAEAASIYTQSWLQGIRFSNGGGDLAEQDRLKAI